MKYRIALGVLLLILLAAFWYWYTRPVPLVPTSEPTVVDVRPPILPPRGTVVVVDPSGETRRVPVSKPEKVVATITIPADTTDTVLLIEKPPRILFPEVGLRRASPRVRVLGVDLGVSPITVVPQRISVIGFGIHPYMGAGVALSGRPMTHVGIAPLRLWFLNLGGGVSVEYGDTTTLEPVFTAHVRVTQFLAVGITSAPAVGVSLLW